MLLQIHSTVAIENAATIVIHLLLISKLTELRNHFISYNIKPRYPISSRMKIR